MSAPRYAERLWPPVAAWIVAAAVAASLGLAFGVPYGATVGTFVGAVAVSATLAGLVALAGRVEVVAGELRAGRAHLPIQVIARAVPLDTEAAARLRGREGDARAYLFLRGWVPTAVRVDLADPRDPTPYWYVSTRRPAALAGAVEAARAAERPST